MAGTADSSSMNDQQKHVSLDSGETLMAHGPHVLYEQVSTTLEAALGRPLPQVEIRFSDLSVSADIVVVEEDTSKTELPTVFNAAKKWFVSAEKHQVRKEILKNVSGSFKPGTITLLLGQPSSGKSSLMKILSSRFPMEKNITVVGEIAYNGVAQQTVAKTVPQFAAYVDQRDKHHPVLTVKETLEIAHAFSGSELSRRGDELLTRGTPEENAAALDASRAMDAHYPDVIIQQLGLQNCQGTVVGDAMLRGVSGGERKRVTTGEMEFGMKYATFMDEISTGLDSAATFDIVNTQRSIAKNLRKTVVIALLQPSPEVFSLFDDVMIMNDGEVMYHGPRGQVIDYFEALGFVCPPERDIADFLLDLGTKQQQVYEVTLPSNPQYQHPRLASEFAEVFRQSAIHAKTARDLETSQHPELLASVREHMEHLPEFHQSFWANTATLFRRQIMVQFRNTPFIVSRLMMILIMGVLNGSTFYQFDPRQIQVVMGIIFASVLFLTTGQLPLLPTFFAAREIFYKQRRANFFRTSAYVAANALAQFPMALTETVLFGSLVYWMCGFAASAKEFIIFEVILFLVSLMAGMCIFFLTAICSDNNVATPVSVNTINTTVMLSGFIVLKSKIPDYLIWIYWINPMSWSLRGLAVNQYRSSEFDICESDGVDYCTANNGMTMGEYYLSLFDVATEKYWVYYAMVVLAAFYVLLLVLATLALEYKRYEAPQTVITTKKEGDGSSSSSSSSDAAGGDDRYVLAATPKRLNPSAAGFHAPSGDDVVVEVHSKEAHFIPVTLAFKNLWYTVPLPSNPKESIDLLKGVSGYALPGTMTALMGSSGAGKTTLMDVIAGRKSGGKIRGQILLNGHEATDLSIRRATGYCEQMDIHSDASTIREALTFSAFLRQDSSMPASAKHDSVNECLNLLDMHAIADEMIRGRSVEQMKRLTIGVELAAQPSVLFLDEPTSGLDARSAKLIMDGVRKVADTGRTVVCTIHQPSSEVFFLFDSLLLLKRGGETVFFGDLGASCRNLVNYFASIPGVAPLPGDYNPATWMLECIGAGVGNGASGSCSGDQATDFVQVFNGSPHKKLLDAAMVRPGVATPVSHTTELVFTQKRAASSMTQMKFVVGRFLDLYWRSPPYNLTRLVVMVILALQFGLIFAGADYASYQGINSGIGMLFVTMAFSGFVALTSVIPIVAQEKPSFYRERAAQTYNSFWYFVGSSVAEIPYTFASGLLFTAIFYPMVGFTGFTTAVLFWVNFSLMLLMQAYLGQLLVYAMPSEEVAAVVAATVNNILILFMGFSPPASTIPSGYQWLYTITPPRFPLSIAAALVFADCSTDPIYDATTDTWSNVGPELGCQPLANSPMNLGPMTVKEFTEGVFRMEHDKIALYLVVVLICITVFRVLAALALRYINHQKR